MIAARQIAFGKAAGKKKPYDAEVEWISFGTKGSYIDTGITTAKDISCRVEFDLVSPELESFDEPLLIVYGLGDSWQFFSYGLFYSTQLGQSTVGRIVFHGNASTLTDVLTSDGSYIIEIEADNSNNAKLYINGQLKGPGPITNIDGGSNFRVLFNRSMENPFNQVLLRSCKFMRGDELLLDFIHVRKGNIGYMYDRVSGQLFGNQGTGEFVLGADIIDYTDDDYPKDGIIVMWDGIKTKVENGCWYDSIGKRELILNGGFTKTDNGVRFARSQYGECEMIDAINAILAGSFTIEFVVTFHEVTTNVGGIITFGTTEDTSSSRLLNIWGGSQGDNKFFDFTAYRSSSYVGTYEGENCSAPINIPVSVSFVANGSSAYLYVNNVFMKQIPSGKVTVATTQMFSLNRAWTVGREGQSATYHNVRMYTRALSEQERQWTYLIDKARFGL